VFVVEVAPLAALVKPIETECLDYFGQLRIHVLGVQLEIFAVAISEKF
jgi:hypothetical protein